MKIFKMIYLLIILIGSTLVIYMSCSTKKTSTKQNKELGYGFKKDSSGIWFYDQLLTGVDVNTFDILDENYCKDKAQVFYFRTYRESSDYFTSKRKQIQQLVDADPGTFSTIGYEYAKDKSKAWCKGTTFSVTDASSLTALNFHFTKDKVNVYVDCQKVEAIDGSTFELLDDQYAKDARTYFYVAPTGDGKFSIESISAQYNSFVKIERQYAKDNVNVFYKGKKINQADPSSFTIIGDNYSKDKHNVFYNDQILQGADPGSFQLFEENELSNGETIYAHDKNSIFANDHINTGIDKSSFKILNEKYSLDKAAVYYHLKKIKGADPHSFKVFPHFIGDADAKDKLHKYGEGNIVE
jgi:hypothetical protein